MGLQKLACQVEAGDELCRLDQFLSQAFADRLSRRRIRRLIETGAVYVDGKRVRVASRKVRPPSRVEIYVDETASTSAAGALPHPEIRILYEDEDLIAVDKPSGVPAQATLDDASSDLFSQLRRFLTRRDAAPAYLALHHRLDRGTSGVMVFAKQRRANRGLAEAFTGRRVRKSYQALSMLATPEPPPDSWVSSNYLSSPRDLGEGPRRVVAVDATAGRLAETEFRVLQRFAGAVWIEAVPRTGRTHQIRVHLAERGLPVLGDPIYAGEAVARIPAPRLMLHAASISFEHPVTGEPLCVESPLPEDFQQQIRAL